MTVRWLVYGVAIAVLFWGLSFVLNGVFFGSWAVTWQQGLIGAMLGFFAGALLDLFQGSVGQPEA